MPVQEAILEMQGKISLLDNRKFIFWTIFTISYNLLFLGYLCCII